MKISISVMAHPSRAGFFQFLCERLGNIPIFTDNGGGVWETCKGAWMKYDRSADYHVVLQDDAIPCERFIERADEFITGTTAKNPSKRIAFSFYFGNRTGMKKIADEGMKVGFIDRSALTWGVAVCMQTKWIPFMVSECDKMNNKQDDVRIGKFLHKNGFNIFYPMPSLVDHRTGIESLVGDPGRGRHAFYFVDNENKSTNQK